MPAGSPQAPTPSKSALSASESPARASASAASGRTYTAFAPPAADFAASSAFAQFAKNLSVPDAAKAPVRAARVMSARNAGSANTASIPQWRQ